MINGVLVERTIKEVIPSLKTNAEGLKQVLDELLKQYKAKQTEMDNWKVRLHHGGFVLSARGCVVHAIPRNIAYRREHIPCL